MELKLAKKSTGEIESALTDSQGRLMTTGGNLGLAAIEGRLYYYATQDEVAQSDLLNTTFTGLAIGNPNGSGKYYIMHEFGWAFSAAYTNESDLSLIVTTTKGLTNTAPTTVKPALVGGAMLSEAIADEAATISTPTFAKFICSLDDHAVATQWTSVPQVADLRGSIVLTPGYAVASHATVALDAVMYFHFVWEEIDMP